MCEGVECGWYPYLEPGVGGAKQLGSKTAGAEEVQERVGRVLMPSGKHHRLLSTLLVLSHHSLLLTLLLGSCPYGHRSLCPHGVSASSASPVGLPHLSSRMSHHRNTGISVLPLTLPLWSRLTFPHPCSWWVGMWGARISTMVMQEERSE